MKSPILFLFIFFAIPCIFSQTKNDDIVNNKDNIFPSYTFNFYSGYLNISNTKSYHYIYFESQSKPESSPLILWLNGGPGCSSLLGSFYENGPFLFNTNGVRFQPNLNPYSWNKFANLLYIESPAGVGFSTGSNDEIKNNSNDFVTAEDNLNSLLLWLKRFPEITSNKNEIYVMGESYAGTYVPFLALAIDTYNNNQLNINNKINFKGWAVGNACTHPDECVGLKMKFKTNSSSYAYDFYWGQGKYSPESRKTYENVCLKNPGSQACRNIQNNIQNEINSTYLNVYDVYETCFVQGLPSVPPCSDGKAAYEFFNNNTIKSLFHVNTDINWTMCSDLVSNNYQGSQNASYWIYTTLLPTQKYRVMVFSGDVDASVPITGTKTWVDILRNELNLPTISPWRPWFYPGKRSDEPQVAGFTVSYPNFTFASVRGVGHMVPQWGPAQAYYMIQSYLNNQELSRN